jgi:hypothetical protein
MRPTYACARGLVKRGTAGNIAPRTPSAVRLGLALAPAYSAREVKFRQAAFVYLHVLLLHLYAGFAMWRAGFFHPSRLPGPPWIWLIVGGALGFAVFLALLRWQNAIFTRVIWVVHGVRIPALVHGAFFTTDHPGALAPSFFVTALVIIVINLWMLARAAWDL